MDPLPRNQSPATRKGFLYSLFMSQMGTTVDVEFSPKFQYILYEYSV